MKVLLAGAFGNLGYEILKELIRNKHEVIAADLIEKETELKGNYTYKKIDITNPSTLSGICEECDVLITTCGLTGASTKVNNYDIDYKGNLNLINEARKAGIKKINYISVIKCDDKDAKDVPMLNAKYLVEKELQNMKDIDYVIYRPTGYFYDIAKVFKPYIDKGEMQLLKGYDNVKANVVYCPDFAAFIVEHMNDTNQLYEVGGKETYSYLEMAEMCFKAAGKPVKIKYAPKWLFGILANLPKIKKAGKHDIILFSKFTLSHDLVGNTKVGESSFKEYIQHYFGGK